jgi:predicted CopG family antitoxin
MARDERKNIKCQPMTYRKLKTLKRDDETWDEVLIRLAEYGELVSD